MGFWRGFTQALQEEDAQKEARRLFLMKAEEDRKNLLTELILKQRAAREQETSQTASVYKRGMQLLGDPDVVAALYQSGDLENIIAIADKRQVEGTLDEAWIPSVVASIKNQYGDNIAKVGDAVRATLEFNGDLTDPGNQDAAMIKAISGSVKDMEDYYMKNAAPSPAASLPPTMTGQPLNVPYDKAEKQDTTEATKISSLVDNTVGNLFNGILTVQPQADGTTTIIADPNSSDPGMSRRAMLYLQTAKDLVPTLVKDYNMDPTAAVGKLAEYTLFGIENGQDPMELRAGLGNITPESTYDFTPSTPAGTANVSTEGQAIEAIGNLEQPTVPDVPQPVEPPNDFNNRIDQWWSGRQ